MPTPGEEDNREPWEKTQDELDAENKKPRRGRPPKAAEQTGPEGDKKPEEKAPRKGRPPKADKSAPDKAAKPVRDKVSQGKKAPTKGAPAKETVPEPTPPPDPANIPRPVEQGQVVYLKFSELHAFHTFRDHPYKVQDDDKMKELVGTIQEHGVMTPATVRTEKDGNGYEIIAGHRRQHGSQLAGLEEMPCIVRDMTDLEAVREMKISNKQRGDPLPSKLARLFDLEVEAIKHQGGSLDGVAEGDIGKRSTEIVGENNGMNYKKVMRYIRLNSLVPDLLNLVDDKKMGFMPAVELSYIKPKNQWLIAVSIEGEQFSPSLSQAQKLRELDKEGKLNGDVIDGILSPVNKILFDERYTGADGYDPIISADVFSRATNRRAEELEKAMKATTKGCKLGNIYPLSGFIVCPNCGSTYVRHTQNVNKHDRIVAWQCGNSIGKSDTQCKLYFNIADVTIEKLCIESYNRVIADNSLIEISLPKRKHIEVKADGKITKKIEQLGTVAKADDTNKIEALNDEISALLGSYIDTVWAETPLDLTEYITEDLWQYLADNTAPMTEFDEKKFKSLFKNITAIKPGELAFVLKNGAQLTLNYTPLRWQENLWKQKLQRQ